MRILQAHGVRRLLHTDQKQRKSVGNLFGLRSKKGSQLVACVAWTTALATCSAGAPSSGYGTGRMVRNALGNSGLVDESKGFFNVRLSILWTAELIN